jgi:hypothetical protein
MKKRDDNCYYHIDHRGRRQSVPYRWWKQKHHHRNNRCTSIQQPYAIDDDDDGGYYGVDGGGGGGDDNETIVTGDGIILCEMVDSSRHGKIKTEDGNDGSMITEHAVLAASNKDDKNRSKEEDDTLFDFIE